jgi:hypothetical protein
MSLFGQRIGRGIGTIALVGGFVGSGAAVVLASSIPEAGAVPTVSPCPAPVISGTTATVTCSYNGTNGTDGSAQSWTVPPGVTQATFDVYGAQGGGNGGSLGQGGRSTATFIVAPGTTFTVVVGGIGGAADNSNALTQPSTAGPGGFGGGGAGGTSFLSGSGGGGASSVSGGTGPLVVAGGGGGNGVFSTPGAATGGVGGGASGDFGHPNIPDLGLVGGAPGTQTGPGVGSELCPGGGGGGGGGGYYGGAGGTGCFGGGGGSGFIDPSGTSPSLNSGVQSGNGKVVITYTVPDHDLSLAQPSNITNVNATSPSGAVVTYATPAVSDPDDTSVPAATCTPVSGSTFAIGTTTVTCSVSDSDDTNSPQTTSFTVSVLGAPQQLAALQSASPGKILQGTLGGAVSQLSKGHTKVACSLLKTYIFEVQVGEFFKLIPVATANQLIASAKNIEAVIPC